MARLDKKNLGNVKGKVGDLVFRNLFGNTYIASAPVKYTTPMDEVSVKNRNKFSFFQALSSAVGQIYWFKQIWKNSRIPGNIFNNKFFTANNKLVTADYNINDILLIPVEDGFYAEAVSSSFTTKQLTVTVAQLGSDSGIKKNKKISAQGLIYLQHPKNQNKAQYAFLPVFSDDLTAVEGEEITFTLLFSDLEQSLYKAYNSHSFVINLMTKDAQGAPKNASINICG